MEEHEIKKMGLQELAKYMDEQKRLGRKREYTQAQIAELRGIPLSTLKEQTKNFREKGEQKEPMEEQKGISESQENVINVQNSTPDYIDFTEEDVKVLKKIIWQHKRDIEVFHQYTIYRELEKVATGDDVKHIRSAFNMSIETTERLKKFSQFRRIPLQDLVELAVMNLLNEYDK